MASPLEYSSASVDRIAQARAQLRARRVALRCEPLGELPRLVLALAAHPAGRVREDPEHERRDDPRVAVAVAERARADEPEPEDDRQQHAAVDREHGDAREPEQERDLARPLAPQRGEVERRGGHRAADEEERARHVQEQQPVVLAHARENTNVDETRRHLQLLTETIEAVNSTLDLEEVLGLVARKVADALGADACFVYLYDERGARARAPRDARDARRGDDEAPAAAARPGHHRRRRGGAAAGDAAGGRAPRSALQGVPEPAGGPLPVDPRRADPRARHARGRAQRPHDRAARVHAGGDRPAARDRGAGGAVDPARAAVRRGAAARRRAGGARAHLGGGVGLALPRGVARRDRAHDDGRARRDGCGARARRRRDRVARGPQRRVRRAAAAALARAADRRARLRPRHAVLRRRPAAARRRSRTTRPSRSSTGAR